MDQRTNTTIEAAKTELLELINLKLKGTFYFGFGADYGKCLDECKKQY